MSKWFRPKAETEAAAPKPESTVSPDVAAPEVTAPAPAPERPKSFRERFVAVMTEPIHFGPRPQAPDAAQQPVEPALAPVAPEPAPVVVEATPIATAEVGAAVRVEPATEPMSEAQAAEKALSFRERLVAVLTEPITFGSKPETEHAERALESTAERPGSVDGEAPRSLRERLAASARALTSSVGSLFKRNPKLDEDLLEELETALIQSDFGVLASTELVEEMRVRMRRREFADAQALLRFMRKQLRLLLEPYAKPLNIPAHPKPFVILTVGVNGAGKTTTIGKLAQRYKLAGHQVLLAAGDTFRAAAVEQLKTVSYTHLTLPTNREV